MTSPITSYSLRTHGSLDNRDKIAKKIIRDIASLNISLAGKTIIDVGCRSGENMLAMQAQGATVIGIDPDDSEFHIALKKGAKVDQLFKKTLQEFRAEFPERKFDIATVFLWNIYLSQYKDVGNALKEIIKPGGLIIVGFHDDIYSFDKRSDGYSVEALLYDRSRKCYEIPFPRSLNRYLFISAPKEVQHRPIFSALISSQQVKTCAKVALVIFVAVVEVIVQNGLFVEKTN